MAVETCVPDESLEVSSPSVPIVIATDGQGEVGVVGDEGCHFGGCPTAVAARPNQEGVSSGAGDHVVDVRYHLKGVPVVEM